MLTISRSLENNPPDESVVGYFNSVRLLTNAAGKPLINNYRDAVRYAIDQDLAEYAKVLTSTEKAAVEEFKASFDPTNTVTTGAIAKTEEDEITDAMDPNMLHRRSSVDTSVGGNSAINPLWQFTRDDDLVHKTTSINGNTDQGLGRVYAEMYDQNQQHLEMSFGIPNYLGMANFFFQSYDSDLFKFLNGGDVTAAGLVGNTFGTLARVAVKAPLVPVKYIANLIGKAKRTPVGKYVEFEPSMYAYYRFVNTILISLAEGMGLTPSEYTVPELPKNATDEQRAEAERETREAYNNMPEILQNNCDIFAILDKRAARHFGRGRYNIDDLKRGLDSGDWHEGSVDPNKVNETVRNKLKENEARVTPDALTGQGEADEVGFFEAIFDKLRRPATKFVGPAVGNMNFVRFRITPNDNSSESFSNSTGDSELGSALKSKSMAGLGKRFVFEGLTKSIPLPAFIKSLGDTLNSFVEGILPGVGVLQSHKGRGSFDIPEVWKDSSYTKSYSFTLHLRAPYGDPISIFQSVYIPLAMLLAGALPRPVGKNMYTSPFMVRAYSKGEFSIPYGIIDSLTIKRGADEYAWTVHGLPTSIQVDFSIKDLTPVLYLGLADDKFAHLLRANESFHEYMSTLSGLSLTERINLSKRMLRRMRIAARLTKLKLTSNTYFTNRMALSSFGQLVAAATPWANELEGAR